MVRRHLSSSTRFRSTRSLLTSVTLGLAVALLLLLAGPQGALSARQHIVIVHQNDLHGRLDPIDDEGRSAGGFARIATLVEAIRRQHPDSVLWLDAGDTWHGTPLANLFAGSPVVEALNEAGLDAMVLGNHDFNFGQAMLAERAAEAAFPVLSANVVRDEGGDTIVPPSAVFAVGGLRVAVLGLTTPETATSMHPGTLACLRFLDPVDVAAAAVPRLRKEADLVVVLSHLGFEADRELAGQVPGIDVIVGGHTHTALYEAVAVGDTLIVQAGEHGRWLGVLELTVEDGRVAAHASRLMPINHAIEPHPRVHAVIEAWLARVPELLEREVGSTEVDLGGEELETRRRETALSNLIADAMRHETGADIALINGGAVRSFIPAGPIRMRHVYAALPFGGPLVGLYLTGAELVEALEHGVSRYPLQWGGFLQVSGVTLTFDPVRPAGERLLDVWVGGEPVDVTATYKVVVNDFLAAGGNEHVTLRRARVWFGSERGDGIGIQEAVTNYLRRVGPVAPQVEGRIRIVSADQPAEPVLEERGAGEPAQADPTSAEPALMVLNKAVPGSREGPT